MGVMLPREKLAERGLSSLSDVELVTILLGSGVDGRSVTQVARSVSRMIRQGIDGGDGVVVRDGARKGKELLQWENFTQLLGVGQVKAMQIVCALELGRRLFGEERGGEVIIGSRKDVISMFNYLRGKKQEHMVAVALDGRNRVVGRKTVAVGSLNQAVVDPRDVFGWVLGKNASGVVFVHNHPSGDVTPSSADEAFTKRMKKAARLLGVEVVDSVVV